MGGVQKETRRKMSGVKNQSLLEPFGKSRGVGWKAPREKGDYFLRSCSTWTMQPTRQSTHWNIHPYFIQRNVWVHRWLKPPTFLQLLEELEEPGRKTVDYKSMLVTVMSKLITWIEREFFEESWVITYKHSLAWCRKEGILTQVKKLPERRNEIHKQTYKTQKQPNSY
jgi:hypothetical protein